MARDDTISRGISRITIRMEAADVWPASITARQVGFHTASVPHLNRRRCSPKWRQVPFMICTLVVLAPSYIEFLLKHEFDDIVTFVWWRKPRRKIKWFFFIIQGIILWIITNIKVLYRQNWKYGIVCGFFKFFGPAINRSSVFLASTIVHVRTVLLGCSSKDMNEIWN